MKFVFFLGILSFLLLFVYAPSFAQTELVDTSQNILKVSFVNNTAKSYEINLDLYEIFTLSQKYSWVKDQNSRYNLVSYSLDGQDFSNILRQSRGNFLLDIPADSSHTVVFMTTVQYPVSIQGVREYSFSPKSPTNDNWFDTKSRIQLLDVTSNHDGLIPYEIKNWEGQGIIISGDSTEIFVDRPITVEARWQPNYLPIALSIGIPILVVAAFFIVKKRPKISQSSSPKPDSSPKPTPKPASPPKTENYRDKTQEFLKQKSLEKLESLLNSKSITNSKYSGIKETLWDI